MSSNLYEECKVENMSNLDALLDSRYSSDSDEIREDYGDAEERAVLIRKAAASFVSSA